MPAVNCQQRSSEMVGCLCFLPLLLVFPPLDAQLADTKANPQLTWSVNDPAPRELQEKKILSKIFNQIIKSGRKAYMGSRGAVKRLSLLYLTNWSESGRKLSPFFPLVSLELQRFEKGRKLAEKGKSPAVIQWGKLRKVVKEEQKNAQKLVLGLMKRNCF